MQADLNLHWALISDGMFSKLQLNFAKVKVIITLILGRTGKVLQNTVHHCASTLIFAYLTQCMKVFTQGKGEGLVTLETK